MSCPVSDHYITPCPRCSVGVNACDLNADGVCEACARLAERCWCGRAAAGECNECEGVDRG